MTVLADPGWAFDAYEAVRERLPKARFDGGWQEAETLADVAGPYSALLLDAYGVLNVGETAIPGVAARIADLRRAGKRVMVVTNSAGYPKRLMMERFARLGFDFAPEDVTSSREALLAALAGQEKRRWGAMLNPVHGLEDFDGLDLTFLGDDPEDYDRVEGFLLIGSDTWTEERQTLLEKALSRRPGRSLWGIPTSWLRERTGCLLSPATSRTASPAERA